MVVACNRSAHSSATWLRMNSWPQGLTEAFTISNAQQPFGEALATSPTSTN